MGSAVGQDEHVISSRADTLLLQALNPVLSEGDAIITPAMEATVQAAIHLLKSCRGADAALERAESISRTMTFVYHSRFAGRADDCAKQIEELKRLVSLAG